MTLHDQALRNCRKVFLLWFVLLTVATHLPQATPPDNSILDMPDKLFHFVFFGALAFFFICSNWVKNIYFSWFCIALWTFLDEYTQDLLPINRPFSMEDLIAGELGVYAAYCWKGALESPQLKEVRDHVDILLASTKNWVILATITILTLLLTTGSIWYLSTLLTGTQWSDLAFFIGSLTALFTGIFVIKRMGKSGSTILKRKLSMVLKVLGTMVLQ